jgi:hypothetical protein
MAKAFLSHGALGASKYRFIPEVSYMFGFYMNANLFRE